MGRRLGLSLLAFAAGVVLLVSAALASPQSAAQRGGTLRLMFGAEPDSVDPALAYNTRASWTLLFASCAKLFNTYHNPDTGLTRVVPEVVRSFSVSGDGRTYTFQLRRGFGFATGAPVTARSFADAFNRTANPGMSSPAVRRGFFEEIVGIDAYTGGKAKAISGVQVLDRYRLRVRLTRKAGDFVGRLAMSFFCPVLPGTPITPAGIEKPPGSGPYYVAERVPNRLIVLERNPHYGGSRTANPDRIVWTIETDGAERLRATEQNRNDFTTLFNYPDAVVRGLVDKYGVNRRGGRLFRYPTSTTFLFAFNPDRPAFRGTGQAPLKKAINYALDRPALTRSHGYLGATATDRLLPAWLTAGRRVYPLGGPDPVTARKWLARAAQRPKTLTLYMANFPLGILNGQIFASNLRQLGIVVDVKYFEFQTLLLKLRTAGEPWDVGWLPWGAAYADPAGFLLPLFRGTQLEPRIRAANNRVTGLGRDKSWAEFEAKLVRDDPPVAAYAHAMRVDLVSSSFGCYRSHILYELDFAAACVRGRS